MNKTKKRKRPYQLAFEICLNSDPTTRFFPSHRRIRSPFRIYVRTFPCELASLQSDYGARKKVQENSFLSWRTFSSSLCQALILFIYYFFNRVLATKIFRANKKQKLLTNKFQ